MTNMPWDRFQPPVTEPVATTDVVPYQSRLPVTQPVQFLPSIPGLPPIPGINQPIQIPGLPPISVSDVVQDTIKTQVEPVIADVIRKEYANQLRDMMSQFNTESKNKEYSGWRKYSKVIVTGMGTLLLVLATVAEEFSGLVPKELWPELSAFIAIGTTMLTFYVKNVNPDGTPAGQPATGGLGEVR